MNNMSSSPVKFQALWRSYSIRAKMHRNGVIAMIGVFVTMIQSTWRGYICRKNNIQVSPIVNGRQENIIQQVRWQRGSTLRALSKIIE
tara:strand:+ start:143 stop:406 length:264 start_codon:yes stop_codon:yes gene_type:complete